ncbi:cyclic-di-AMP receptor [Lagierella sp.]|uniref:cyclic-di-AMP receptor n=1 Tax=Lagierella sp. TaxID=2849657 RepID=UPI002635290B|nr:cyclic-di-AMP receptor [Lagierella sp.]
MKLMIAVVEDDIAHDIIKMLAIDKIRCTKLASTGGVLRKGNTTLLIGYEDESKEKILRIMDGMSKNRLRDPDDDKSYNVNLFTFDLEKMKRV